MRWCAKGAVVTAPYPLGPRVQFRVTLAPSVCSYTLPCLRLLYLLYLRLPCAVYSTLQGVRHSGDSLGTESHALVRHGCCGHRTIPFGPTCAVPSHPSSVCVFVHLVLPLLLVRPLLPVPPALPGSISPCCSAILPPSPYYPLPLRPHYPGPSFYLLPPSATLLPASFHYFPPGLPPF